jgi:quinol monooxygenase YgiN
MEARMACVGLWSFAKLMAMRTPAALATLLALMLQPAHAQNAVYGATYIDIMPAEVNAAISLLNQFRTTSRKEYGNQRFAVAQEIGRANRLVILQTWSDQTALTVHDKAPQTILFRDKMKAIEDSPADERLNNGLYIGSPDSKRPTRTIYVVTHVDVLQTRKDDCMTLLKDMSETARRDPGNIRYDVLQQQNRSNHFTVIEIWKSKRALDAHQMADHTRLFRDRLAPMTGALYDERIYKAVK